jgi:phytoene/squalene synthetase
MGKPNSDKLFVDNFIPRVSRTFALAIKFLPPRLRHAVFAAYLLCRVADTIEDSPAIRPMDKRDRLLRLRNMLSGAAGGGPLRPDDIALLRESVDSGTDHDHRLLSQSGQLFEVLGHLPESRRYIIYRWAAEMAGGMAEFSQMHDGHKGVIIALSNVAEWDRYCYFVAGTVGHMLTELIIGEYKIERDAAARLMALCNSFGLGLQKVNTIKDVPVDRERGVVFLPADLMRRHGLAPDDLASARSGDHIAAFVGELTRISWGHLDDAIEYTTLVPAHLKGVRMFLTLPVFLAAATLGEIAAYPVRTMTGPPVKIGRSDVARLTSAAALYSRSNARLKKYYDGMKRREGRIVDIRPPHPLDGTGTT